MTRGVFSGKECPATDMEEVNVKDTDKSVVARRGEIKGSKRVYTRQHSIYKFF